MKIYVFSGVTLCSPLKVNRCFRGTFILLLLDHHHHHHYHRQNSTFSAIAFLRRFWQIASEFCFFGSNKNNIFIEPNFGLASSRPGLCRHILIGRVAQLYPQPPGPVFIAFYDSQGYSGSIVACLHTGVPRSSG
jgi:hypothetical protein